MQRPLDPGPVVIAKIADPVADEAQIFPRDIDIEEVDLVILEAGLGRPTEIHHDLNQRSKITPGLMGGDAFCNVRGENSEQILKIVSNLVFRG